jgi:hypothetical protein
MGWTYFALTLQSIHDIEGSDSLPFCVLSVGGSVAYNTLEEGLEDTAGILIDR